MDSHDIVSAFVPTGPVKLSEPNCFPSEVGPALRPLGKTKKMFRGTIGPLCRICVLQDSVEESETGGV